MRHLVQVARPVMPLVISTQMMQMDWKVLPSLRGHAGQERTWHQLLRSVKGKDLPVSHPMLSAWMRPVCLGSRRPARQRNMNCTPTTCSAG